MSETSWIAKIAPLALKAVERFGYLPSILIAQTCLENGFGMDSSCEVLTKANNVLGMKRELLNDTWRSDYWKGGYITKTTPEWENGKVVKKRDTFRKYDSLLDCLCDYLQFMRDAKYSNGTYKYRDVLSYTDPYTLISTVAGRGYCTDPSYPAKIMKIVDKYGLAIYDSNFLKEGRMALSINRDFITTNNSNDTNVPIAIVIHNTDNDGKGADAYAHAEGLARGWMKNMSWHYAVDDKSIYQCLPHNRGAWHVGKNYGTDNLFGKITNRNSIGIEMCMQAGYDYEKAFQNTVLLTKYLMKELGIPAEHVYQHYDICSKNCPSQIRARNDWSRFKQAIASDDVVPGTMEKVVKTPAPVVYTLGFETIKHGSSGPHVKLLQRLLKSNGCRGKDGKVLTLDGECGGNTVHAINRYQSKRRKAGVELGTDGKNDGMCGKKMWEDILRG